MVIKTRQKDHDPEKSLKWNSIARSEYNALQLSFSHFSHRNVLRVSPVIWGVGLFVWCRSSELGIMGQPWLKKMVAIEDNFVPFEFVFTSSWRLVNYDGPTFELKITGTIYHMNCSMISWSQSWQPDTRGRLSI